MDALRVTVRGAAPARNQISSSSMSPYVPYVPFDDQQDDDRIGRLTMTGQITRRDFVRTASAGAGLIFPGNHALSQTPAAERQSGGRPAFLTPRVTLPWTRIVEYPTRLNDFCLFRDRQDMWHCIGIIGDSWEAEQSFFHSTGSSLAERFINRLPLMTAMPDWLGDRRSDNRRPQKHAPCVIFHEGLYHMFYRRPWGTILVARSPDPLRWPDEVELVFEAGDARDVCILPTIGGLFHMYYCQSAAVEGHTRRLSDILLRTSPDLRSWSDARIAHYDSRPADHSKLESPFVLSRSEGFYLFARDRYVTDRCLTRMYFSTDPARFPSGERAWFGQLEDVHAPELVQAGGQHYIARVSGPSHANPNSPVRGGWIEVARLDFGPE